MMLKTDAIPDGNEGFHKVVRLRVHVVYRVFGDRLVDGVDKTLFYSIVKVCSFVNKI